MYLLTHVDITVSYIVKTTKLHKKAPHAFVIEEAVIFELCENYKCGRGDEPSGDFCDAELETENK